MPALIERDGVTCRIEMDFGAIEMDLPQFERASMTVELERPFELQGMEHKLILTPKPYGGVELTIKVRCDGATDWSEVDAVAWSPDSIIDTPFLPKASRAALRHALFLDIMASEQVFSQAYHAACEKVIDEGGHHAWHPSVKVRDDIASALGRLRDVFGKATIERRILAEIRENGDGLELDAICNRVRRHGPSVSVEAIEAEVKRMSTTSDGSLIKNERETPYTYDLAYEPISEVEMQKIKKAKEREALAVKEREAMVAARLATEARKARELAEGTPPVPQLEVVWTKSYMGRATATCTSGGHTSSAGITPSTVTEAWTVTDEAYRLPSAIAEDEEAARYLAESRVRTEVLRLEAKARNVDAAVGPS